MINNEGRGIRRVTFWTPRQLREESCSAPARHAASTAATAVHLAVAAGTTMEVDAQIAGPAGAERTGSAPRKHKEDTARILLTVFGAAGLCAPSTDA